MGSINLLSKEAVSYTEAPICLKPNIGPYHSPCYVCKISNTQHSILTIISLVDYSSSKYKIIPHESVNEKKVSNYKDQFFSGSQLINPIVLFYKKYPELRLFLSNLTRSKSPDTTRFIHGTKYEIWSIYDCQKLYDIQKHFQKIKNFYIADGHHRVEALTSLKGCALYPFPKQYLSVVLGESDLNLASFNRFIHKAKTDCANILKKLSKTYNLKKVFPGSIIIQKNIYFYTESGWYELELNELLQEKEKLFPAIFLDKFLTSELELDGTSSFDKFLYLPQTDKVGDIINYYKSYNCQLAISIPKASLLDLYKITEKGERLPPHSTCFTPKMPDNLFIQYLQP